MRDEFRAELAEVSELLVAMADEVRSLMKRATRALLAANAAVAEGVITGDTVVNDLHKQVEEKVYDLLARQAPVASDLRQVVTALHTAWDIERMGDLAKHVAKAALRRHPATAVPTELVDVFRDMAAVADAITAKASALLARPDATAAAALEAEDDAMDALHQSMFAVLAQTSPPVHTANSAGPAGVEDATAAWRQGIATAADCALLGRYYERYADHAVNAGGHMYFFVTGEALQHDRAS